jgi:tetratricopeptide (TPR) repeat protein
MSLLLDALKKAADDKQKALQSVISSEDPAAVQVAEEGAYQSGLTTGNEISSIDETLTLSESFSLEDPQQAVAGDPGDNEALTLDPVESEKNESVLTLDETEIAQESASAGFVQQADKKDKKTAESKVTGNKTVSDEALSLLIHKTNREVKTGKWFFLISIFLASLAVLVSGGVYYYYEMQAEFISLERKHQLAMQQMRVKTSDEKMPEKSEIIRSFVNNSEPEDKVKLAKKQIISESLASGKNIQQKNEAKTVAKKQANTVRNSSAQENTVKNDTSVVSIRRTNTADPLGEKLDAAWLVYERAQYDEAEELYTEAMHLEKNNRDALLGLGAIAIQKKDAEKAKRYYLTLLKLDPRDPIATAAIASLHSDKTSIEAGEEYLTTMLESNPKAAHLNFALGNIYAKKREWKAAQQSYFNAWQQDSENADYLFNLAVSMDQLNKQEQALKFYKECLLKSNNKQVGFSREAVEKRISELAEFLN